MYKKILFHVKQKILWSTAAKSQSAAPFTWRVEVLWPRTFTAIQEFNQKIKKIFKVVGNYNKMYVLQNKIILVKEVHFSPVAASFPKIDSFSLLTNRPVVLSTTIFTKHIMRLRCCDVSNNCAIMALYRHSMLQTTTITISQCIAICSREITEQDFQLTRSVRYGS